MPWPTWTGCCAIWPAPRSQVETKNALNGAAWTLGHWVAAGALDQREVEDALYAAGEQNGLGADDGPLDEEESAL